MDQNTGAVKGTGTSHRDAASPSTLEKKSTLTSPRGLPQPPTITISEPEETKNKVDQKDKNEQIKKTRSIRDIGKALSKKASKFNLKARKGNQATSTTEPPTHELVSSPGIEKPASDAHHQSQLPQFHAQHTSEDQPVEGGQTDQEYHHSQEGLAEESEPDEEDEPEGQGRERPQLSNLARYFWSRLDVAYKYYVDGRNDDCRELILETLPRGMVPIACRCELLHLLACVMPWEQAQDCLDDADELCQEMDMFAPSSERVLQLRTKGNNVRGALREYHEIVNESRSTSDDEEMDDLAE